ncbi:Fur family transcriptional regulator [Candidatus Palauibacter sp.]|uniref:Fur family transcriptional regulator n=1 Tax=Candidatus Palauibacter sp. TaxID=3101350 RepID=UPI003AF1E7BE
MTTDILTPRPPLGCAAVMLGLFRAALREQHLPVTQQREAIARVLFESGQRLSADDVTARLGDEGERVGKATVYRTLSLLVRVGLATEHDFDEGFKRYEAQVGQAHDHLICTACGVVSRFQRDELNQLQAEVARQFDFHVLRRQLKLYGLCSRCDAESGRVMGQIN